MLTVCYLRSPRTQQIISNASWLHAKALRDGASRAISQAWSDASQTSALAKKISVATGIDKTQLVAMLGQGLAPGPRIAPFTSSVDEGTQCSVWTPQQPDRHE
ncbi:unnamed protein product [Nippostrongylus brasiliensis]|uniref:Lipoprotein n=1 Tax=Nippostrongylus brasiliensis TaxID=27835 RepID=A0A0N4Y4T5_NIPBR|nr:unnamed protein product [Nippostrongylus brasiliensis]